MLFAELINWQINQYLSFPEDSIRTHCGDLFRSVDWQSRSLITIRLNIYSNNKALTCQEIVFECSLFDRKILSFSWCMSSSELNAG